MSEIFRDRTEGAIARRQELLRKRRDEFFAMPHAIRRVVVARAARRAAALAMIVAGTAMVIVALSPTLAGYIARGLPGINPAVVSTFVGGAWIVGLVAWATSRARSEHRFAVEMMKYALPGQDLDQDIERLSHEHPDTVARRMAHRLEVSSAALPVAAAALVVPATLVYVAHGLYAKGWPSTADYELNLLQVGSALAAAGIAGMIAAIVMTRRWARSPSLAPAAFAIAVITGIIAATALKGRALPATWLFTVISVITGAIAFVNWRLTRERKAIEAEDPAAGSELFTLRGAVAACKSAFGGPRRRMSTQLAVGAIAYGAILVCAGDAVGRNSKRVTAATKTELRNAGQGGIEQRMLGSTYEVLPTGDGRLRVAVSIVDGNAVHVPSLSGMKYVPLGWKARVTVRLETQSLPAPVQVTPFLVDANTVPLHFSSDSLEHRFSSEVCDPTVADEQELGLRVVPDATWPKGTHQLTFLIEPVLELATCR